MGSFNFSPYPGMGGGGAGFLTGGVPGLVFAGVNALFNWLFGGDGGVVPWESMSQHINDPSSAIPDATGQVMPKWVVDVTGRAPGAPFNFPDQWFPVLLDSGNVWYFNPAKNEYSSTPPGGSEQQPPQQQQQPPDQQQEPPNQQQQQQPPNQQQQEPPGQQGPPGQQENVPPEQQGPVGYDYDGRPIYKVDSSIPGGGSPPEPGYIRVGDHWVFGGLGSNMPFIGPDGIPVFSTTVWGQPPQDETIPGTQIGPDPLPKFYGYGWEWNPPYMPSDIPTERSPLIDLSSGGPPDLSQQFWQPPLDTVGGGGNGGGDNNKGGGGDDKKEPPKTKTGTVPNIPLGGGAPVAVPPVSTIGGKPPYQTQFPLKPYEPLVSPSLSRYIELMQQGGLR
jgi:hypothetical protein